MRAATIKQYDYTENTLPSIGTTSLIANALGEKDKKKVLII